MVLEGSGADAYGLGSFYVHQNDHVALTYSGIAFCTGGSDGDSSTTSIENATFSSNPLSSDGVLSCEVKTKGALCGRGEMSMQSLPRAGDDDRGGGVVVESFSYFSKR